jgi:drug/metabolite transporter (DMT)-like permease
VKEKTQTGPVRAGLFFGFSAAVLAGAYIPLSKLLLNYLPDMLQGGTAYLGAGIGNLLIFLFLFLKTRDKEMMIQGKEWIWGGLLMIFDILALFFFYLGLAGTSSETSSLLASTELLITALLAFIFFHEKIGWLTWNGIILVTAGTACLAISPESATVVSYKWLYVLVAYIFWAAENNFATKIARRSPFLITGLKCSASGLFLFIFALASGQRSSEGGIITLSVLVGFIAAGCSIACLIMSERLLGASKATAIYSSNPLIGLTLSFIIFHSTPYWSFYLSLSLMLAGLFFAIYEMLKEDKKKQKEIKKQTDVKQSLISGEASQKKI